MQKLIVLFCLFRFADLASCTPIGSNLPLACHLAVTPELQGTGSIYTTMKLNKQRKT
jgi:hypothetical protein